MTRDRQELFKTINNSFPFLLQVKTAAALLLESKMFYVPFLLNSSID